MAAPPPRNANEFIEQQLDERAKLVMEAFGADLLGFTGGIIFGVDDIVRNVIEHLAQVSAQKKLVVVLTTLGGYIEVVQRIVDTVRHHYESVDFIVPNYAFSAGTVLAMSGDAIHMNYYSRLGPIDPQVETAKGRMVPALGYLVQWERLIEKARNGELTTAEAQLMIDGFDQAELYQFEQARELSVTLLKEWLTKYKFKNWKLTRSSKTKVTHEMRVKRAEEIARELNDPEKWHSHGYGISMDVLRRDLNLLIDDFDADTRIGSTIRDYYSLLDDYMMKRGNTGVLHTVSQYVPYM
jgi:heme-degrading monooxygenase HmoA